MRTRNVVNNTLMSVVVQLATIMAGLILPRLVLLTYGSALNGLRASISQFVGYLYILEMGLAGSLTYFLYKPIAENNTAKINGILSAAKKSYRQIGFLFIGFVFLIAIIYPLLIRNEEIDLLTIIILITATGAAGVIDYFITAKYNVLLLAAQRNSVTSFFRVIYLILNTIIIVTLINLQFNISTVYFLALFANLAYSLMIYIYMKKNFSYINFAVAEDKSALAMRYDVLIHQISAMVVFNAPILILTILCDLTIVSIYSIYALVFVGVNMILGGFYNGFASSFGELILENNIKKLQKAYSEFEFLYYIILTFIYSCVLILGLPFIKIYTAGIKDANYIDLILFLLFVVVGVLNNWKIPQSTIMGAAGHFRQIRHRAIIEVVVTLTFGILLTRLLGLHGVLIGCIAGLAYRSIDLLYAERITGLKFRYTFVRLIRVFIVGFIAVLPFITYVQINPRNLTEWLFMAVMVSIWVLAVVILGNFIVEKNTVKCVLNRLFDLFGKNHSIKGGKCG